MDFSAPHHKKVIGYCYIVFGVIGILSAFFYDLFMETFFTFLPPDEFQEFDMNLLFEFISNIVWGIAILFHLPRLIIGFGLAQGKTWANIPGLVFGILSIINFPVGTVLGVYAILAFTAKPKVEEAH